MSERPVPRLVPTIDAAAKSLAWALENLRPIGPATRLPAGERADMKAEAELALLDLRALQVALGRRLA